MQLSFDIDNPFITTQLNIVMSWHAIAWEYIIQVCCQKESTELRLHMSACISIVYTHIWYGYFDILVDQFIFNSLMLSKRTPIGSDNGLAPMNQCWDVVNRTLVNKFQWNLKRNSYIFSQENAFENVVCEMAVILSGSYCVKKKISQHNYHQI